MRMPDPLLPSMLENQVGKNGVWAPQEASPVLLYSVCAIVLFFLGYPLDVKIIAFALYCIIWN